MAAHSNRSPSPLSSRPINPNPKNSDNNSSTRRSFNNNPYPKPSVLTNSRRLDPITPANSPSDFSRRRSVGKESMAMGSSLKHCEEKENNEKDEISKAFKLQSPVKGCKNFMAPTISAASKFTPSPRKKVLVDRNDPVRTSISLCDGKAVFFSEIGLIENEIKETTCIDSNVILEKKEAAFQEVAPPPLPKPSKKMIFSDVSDNSLKEMESIAPLDADPSEIGSVENEIKETTCIDSNVIIEKKESAFQEVAAPPPLPKPSKKVTFSDVSDNSLKKMESTAPLDADPSLPPYDPKTNYLSPRPQFLHYKPNPRVEILLNKEKNLEGCKQLEDFFLEEIMSQNFSDSEEGTTTVREEESNTEEESEASYDMVLGFDEMKEDPFVSNAESEEILVQKRAKKTWVISKFMCVSMVLMLLILACVSISVTRSSTLNQIVFKDMSFTDLSNFYHQSLDAASVKVNFDMIAMRVNEFSFSPMASISKLIESLGKEEKLIALQFMNISDLQKDIMNAGNFMDIHLRNELVDNVEEDEMEEDVDAAELEAFEEEVYEELDSDGSYDYDLDTQDEVLENSEIVESQTEEVISNINPETLSGSKNSEEDQLVVISRDQDVKFEAETVEVASEATEIKKLNGDIFTGSSEFSDISTKSDHETPLEVDSVSEGFKTENEFLAHYYVIGFSSLLLAAIVGGAFLHHQRMKNARMANVVVQKQNITYPQEKQEISQNWQTEVDVVGESCPSEISSSFQKSASYRKKGESETTQSWSKYSKRDSLCSSSASEYSTSPSYGSFTTYERIPMKKANGDERIITPVRRSSRIRTKITSP
ncbi:hypothetical protein ACJIZ3_014286 [Penstemon smallii]|uniref:Transmembrane protein n=1 Tax=Penstemon smallii TaxID=265156 RepID=A0ABD3RJ66_9LAMI